MSNTTLPPEKVKEIKEAAYLHHSGDAWRRLSYIEGATDEAIKAYESAQAQQMIIHHLSAEIERLKKEIEFLNAKW